MAEQTITLTASAYSVSNNSNFTVTNPSNAYVNIANATYTSYTQIRSTTTSTRYAYFYGFDFSQIPSDATVTSMVFKIAAGVGGSASSNCTVSLRNRTTNTALSSEINTPTMPSQGFPTTTLTLTSLSYDDVIALGDSFAFATKLTSSSISSQAVFGMEIAVTYGYPAVNKVDYNNRTLIDLTSDTVTTADVALGKLFHLANGEQATGTGGGLEYETGTWSPSSNETRRGTINLTKTHTAPPAIFAVWTTKSNGAMNSSSACTFLGADYSALGDYTGSTNMPAGGWVSRYINSSGTQTNTNGYIANGGDNSGDSSSSYWRYFATESALYPYTASSMIWRSNTVYGWIAIWV